MGRMDEMGKRMDELEHCIGELMDQAGLEREALQVLPTRTSTSSKTSTSNATPSSMATAEI